jgi:hypothetical protein
MNLENNIGEKSCRKSILETFAGLFYFNQNLKIMFEKENFTIKIK